MYRTCSVQKSNMLASWAGWGINYMIYHFFLDNR